MVRGYKICSQEIGEGINFLTILMNFNNICKKEEEVLRC